MYLEAISGSCCTISTSWVYMAGYSFVAYYVLNTESEHFDMPVNKIIL